MARWNPDDVRRLRKLYGMRTHAEVARLLGKSQREISAKAADLALAKNRGRFPGVLMPRWSKDELRLLRRLYPTTSNTEIARRLGRSVKSVSSKGAALGIKKTETRLETMGRENVRLRRDRGRGK